MGTQQTTPATNGLPATALPAPFMTVQTIDRTITTWDGAVFTARPSAKKEENKITWTDGKTYPMGFSFLTQVLGLDAMDVKTAISAPLNMSNWDIFYAEMTYCKLADEENGENDESDAMPTSAAAENSDLLAEIARLKAENSDIRADNAALKARPSGGTLTLKVSEKGALSVYGMGRFPVTLYREQWNKLLAAKDAIEAFIIENTKKLKTKEESGK